MHGRVVRERRARDVQPRDGFAEVVIDRHEPQREDVPRGGRVVVARRRRRLGDASEARHHRDASTDDGLDFDERARGPLPRRRVRVAHIAIPHHADEGRRLVRVNLASVRARGQVTTPDLATSDERETVLLFKSAAKVPAGAGVRVPTERNLGTPSRAHPPRRERDVRAQSRRDTPPRLSLRAF
jgi:hypothetical protein